MGLNDIYGDLLPEGGGSHIESALEQIVHTPIMYGLMIMFMVWWFDKCNEECNSLAEFLWMYSSPVISDVFLYYMFKSAVVTCTPFYRMMISICVLLSWIIVG